MPLAPKTINRHDAAELVATIKAEILAEWEELSRNQVAAAEAQSRRALRDSLPEFLDHLVDTLRSLDPRKHAEKNSEIASEHGADRAAQAEYSLDEVIYEFHILRSVVINNLESRGPLDGESRRIIHEFIDRGIRKGAVKFVELASRNSDSQTKEIEAAKLEAERANQAKSEFLASMSHEIRTPLGAIMGFVGLMRERELPPKDQSRYLSIIDRNSKHLMRIIDDILDLSKVESGKLEIENIEFSLPEFLTDFAAMKELRAQENGNHFEIKCETAIPSIVVSDPTRIRQILTNVVGNAIKFTDKGSVRLVVGFDSGRLTFRVIDSGIGISPEQRANLFRAFAQADSSITRKFGGSGLGLVLTKKLSEALGGDFYLIDSEVDKGSTFEASVSVGVPYRAVYVSLGDAKPALLAKPLTQQVNLTGQNILLVEDSPDNRMLIKKMLANSGADIVVAEDGEQAVNSAFDKPYDVILMDIQMPNMDGHEAVRTLREKGYNGPIVAISAHAMQEERERGIESGFSAFLTKPIDQISLTNVLQCIHRGEELTQLKSS